MKTAQGSPEPRRKVPSYDGRFPNLEAGVMNEMSQLALVLLFAAGMLVVGQLHIGSRSSMNPFMVQAAQALPTLKPNETRPVPAGTNPLGLR
jgi:hypothetical protein